MLRGLPFTKLHGRSSGHSTVTSSGTSPEPPVLDAATPRSGPRILAVSLLSVHLLHACAQDKYHGCIRNDMMLMMNG
jgi:hypothetical protein